jgi:hypothetical protein
MKMRAGFVSNSSSSSSLMVRFVSARTGAVRDYNTDDGAPKWMCDLFDEQGWDSPAALKDMAEAAVAAGKRPGECEEFPESGRYSAYVVDEDYGEFITEEDEAVVARLLAASGRKVGPDGRYPPGHVGDDGNTEYVVTNDHLLYAVRRSDMVEFDMALNERPGRASHEKEM